MAVLKGVISLYRAGEEKPIERYKARIGHFRIVLCLLFKASLVQNLKYENEVYLHMNENSFPYERLCAKTRFEKEVQVNSEMAY